MAEYQQLPSDVPPSLPSENGRDVGLSYAIPLCQFYLGQRTGANSENVCFSQLGTVLSLSHRCVASVFCCLVRHVGCMITEPKMRRIAAGRIVAGMQDKSPPIPIGMRQKVNDPVGFIFYASVVPSAVKSAVTGALGSETCPFPAIVRRAYPNLSPKGFWCVRSHDLVVA